MFLLEQAQHCLIREQKSQHLAFSGEENGISCIVSLQFIDLIEQVFIKNSTPDVAMLRRFVESDGYLVDRVDPSYSIQPRLHREDTS